MSAGDESPAHNADCVDVQQRLGEHLLPGLQWHVDNGPQLGLHAGEPLQGDDLLYLLAAATAHQIAALGDQHPRRPSVCVFARHQIPVQNQQICWIVACLRCQMSTSSSMQNLGTGIFVFGDTYHFNILVFDHGAVNHCGADGGEIKPHMQSWQ